ncbi:MAG: hypothetical protein MJB57_12275 [Gemmatimonadetes bacterium]|nr:hypothetical protein [Gemmatimonadota bacterium]
MKSISRLALALIVLAVHADVAFGQRVVPSERVRSSVSVYQASDSDSERVGRIRVGESAAHIRSVPRWHEIRLDNGVDGFVSKSWTRVVPESATGLALRNQDELRVHYLNVGAGTCTIVECPGPDAPPMIIDCGSLEPTSVDMDREDTRDYVRDVLAAHDEAPNLVLSHADRDHYGWISHVLDGTQVQNIWMGGDSDDYSGSGFPTWIAGQNANLHQDLEDGWHNDGNPIGSDLDCGDASVFVFTVNSGSSKNGNSLVVNIEYDDFSATFTGDAEGPTEDDSRANFNNLVKTTVLTGSHHGASTHRSNGQVWADSTAPDVVIFSAGRRFRHPRCDAVERFERTLAQAAEHPMQCGTSRRYRPRRNTRLAKYLTEVNGRIVVTSNGRSPLSPFCTGSIGCNTTIAH